MSGTGWYLWGVGFLVSLVLSMILLAKAVQTLPIGTAYLVRSISKNSINFCKKNSRSLVLFLLFLLNSISNLIPNV